MYNMNVLGQHIYICYIEKQSLYGTAVRQKELEWKKIVRQKGPSYLRRSITKYPIGIRHVGPFGPNAINRTKYATRKSEHDTSYSGIYIIKVAEPKPCTSYKRSTKYYTSNQVRTYDMKSNPTISHDDMIRRRERTKYFLRCCFRSKRRNHTYVARQTSSIHWMSQRSFANQEAKNIKHPSHNVLLKAETHLTRVAHSSHTHGVMKEKAL